MTGDPGVADIDQFLIKEKKKIRNTNLLFLDGDKNWQSLTNKRTGELLAAKFGGLNVMKSVLSLDETPSALERSFKATTKLRYELPRDIEMESIPLMELLSLVEDIHVKTRRASRNTDLDNENF